MNYADYGIQNLIDTAHDKIRDTKNKYATQSDAKIALMMESITNMRNICLFYGERASEVFMTYLDALSDFKDPEYIINTKRNIPNIAKSWDNTIVKYLASATPYEIIYFNTILSLVAERSQNKFMENKNQPLYVSNENEHLIQRVGIIMREDMKNYLGIQFFSNRYTKEMAEIFGEKLSNSSIKDFNDIYNNLIKFGNEKRVYQDAKNKLINENQRTLLDF